MAKHLLVRRRKNENWKRDLTFRDSLRDHLDYGKIITVKTHLPVSIANKARTEIYNYPHPLQKRLKRHVLRTNLALHKGPYKLAHVKIRLPHRLPLVRGSYVSLDRLGRLNIHSAWQHRRALERGELNRSRHDERKSKNRRGRHGQLDSPGATSFGAVAAAHRRGLSMARVADAALVARAILKGRVL